MPIGSANNQTLRAKRQAVLRDLIRANNAGISDPDERLADIKKNVVERLGLPESDALWFWAMMNRNGWKFSGVPILDYCQTITNFHRNGFFPSQRIVSKKGG